jgi:hypothetical protein
MTDQERIDIAVIQRDVKYIIEKVECLPGVCSDIARHDERLKAIESEHTALSERVNDGYKVLSGRMWAIVSGVLLSLLGAVLALIKTVH